MGFQNNKNFNYLLLGLNTLFLIYYVMLAVYSRPHYDDLHFLWKMREMSISEYVSDMYFSRSGRFVAYALNGIVFSTINYIQIYWIFPVLFWLIGVLLSVYGVLKLTNQQFTFGRINAVVLIYNVFILTNIDFAVFNWLCALSYYILAPAMLTLLALLVSEKSNFKIISAIMLLAVFLGGGQEAFTPIVLACVLAIVLYELYKNNFNLPITLRSVVVQKSVLSILIMSAMLLIVVLAPGNYKRLAADEFSSPGNLAEYLTGFAKAISMFFYYLVYYIPYYVILALVVLRSFDVNTEFKLLKVKRYLTITVFVYLSYVILSVFPSVYLWGGFGIQRNYTHLVYVSILFFVFCSLWIFANSQKQYKRLFGIFANVGVIALNVIMIFNIYYDSQSASQYAKAVDQRVASAKKQSELQITENLKVKELPVPYTLDPKYILFELIGKKSNPQPVLYYISDADTMVNEYASHFRRYYQLNFDIILENE